MDENPIGVSIYGFPARATQYIKTEIKPNEKIKHFDNKIALIMTQLSNATKNQRWTLVPSKNIEFDTLIWSVKFQ